MEKKTLTIERLRNARAGRAMGSDLTRTGTNDFRARYANTAVMMNVIFTSGIPVIPGTHSAALPTSTARKIASQMLYAAAGSGFLGARTAMPRVMMSGVSAGSMAIAGLCAFHVHAAVISAGISQTREARAVSKYTR